MRVLLVVALLLAGCSEPTPPGDDGPAPDPGKAPGLTPPPSGILPLWNGTLAAGAPGGAGRVPFEAPGRGYVELFLNVGGPVRAVGDLSVVVEAPDGTETVFAQGAFVQDDDEGVAAPGASRSDWRVRIPIQQGMWAIVWSVDGELRLPLFVEAL